MLVCLSIKPQAYASRKSTDYKYTSIASLPKIKYNEGHLIFARKSLPRTYSSIEKYPVVEPLIVVPTGKQYYKKYLFIARS